jgi:carbon storage regulator CsrA
VLVLSRRPSQKILLPGLDIAIHILAIKGHVVRLGFEAPPGVKILREELLPENPPAEPPADGPLCAATA